MVLGLVNEPVDLSQHGGPRSTPLVRVARSLTVVRVNPIGLAVFCTQHRCRRAFGRSSSATFRVPKHGHQTAYSHLKTSFRLTVFVSDSPLAWEPKIASNASVNSPVEMPLRYRREISASMQRTGA